MIELGSDHAGFELKEIIKQHLEDRGLDFQDHGCFGTDAADYPVFAAKTARAVAMGDGGTLGILCCGTGVGISIAANKVRGIRAACCSDEFTAEMARKHNDANILCMGARVISAETALKLVDVFLDTEASEDERHKNRVRMLSDIENEKLIV
ncbi:MAG: ribose 5-phosphate isomerase B [Oscillospiraceae bacterium]|nr:ribose 5-phosphate isomerase B [Oscillospiraceae bacterium]